MLQFGTNMTMKRSQSISTSKHAHELTAGNWKMLPALLLLAWLPTENPATNVFIVLPLCESSDLGVCAAVQH